jgi:hypothetical protein
LECNPNSALWYDLEDYNYDALRRFHQLFPASSLSVVIGGFFYCIGSTPLLSTTEDDDKVEEPLDYDSAFQMILVSLDSLGG